MKAISIGKRFEIYDDSLKSYDRLPAKTYTVRFEKMTGFFLEARTDLTVTEKVYGIHLEKADKVLKAFTMFKRNLGVILSGDKGIGKSLFARLLSSKAVEAGYPVIIIEQFIPGIASYIESIEQKAVILFDEFDKTFGSIGTKGDEMDPQASLLSLFDGTSQGKKLFIITCNNLFGLNDYLVNRPGRFHYHFRFNYPSSEEIRDYLTDKLGTHFHNEIEKVILFSRKVALNFDCLRAIAFELSLGGSFETAIQDLNIINTHEEFYNIELHFHGGITMTANRCRLDLFNSEDKERVEVWDESGNDSVLVEFVPSACVYDTMRQMTILPSDKITLNYTNGCGKPFQERIKKLEPEYMSIVRASKRNIHYVTA